MAAPGGKGGGKANSKATPKGSSSGGRTDTKGVANPQGKAAGSGKKNNRDIDRNPLLGITLEPEVACSLAVKPPTIHSATVVLVLDEEKTSSDPSRGNAETGDIATQLRVSLENLKNAHGRPQTAQNDEPSAGEQGSTPSAGDTSSDCAEALPEIVLITLEDVFEYGRAKSLLIQDAKAKLGSEMKEEDFARSLAQARAEYLSAVERRRLNILQKDALEQSLSKECESPQPSVSLGEAPSLSGGNRRTTEENRTPLKESLASDTGAVPRNLQLGETHVSGQPRGDEERTDEERDAVVDQIDVLFVLLEVPWSPELCAALSEKRLAVDLILFLTPKSVTELREHSSFDRLPTDLHLFYQTINQAPPGSEFSRTAMETIPNIRQQESLAQPWSLIARKSLQVMQEKAAFSAFLSQTRRVEAAKFLEPTLGLPGDAFLRAKAGPSVAGLGSGRRGGKKEEEQELSTHDDDKKKKKKKTSGKKEQDALDRDRSSAHSGDVGIRGGDPGKPLPSLSENRLVYDALFSSIAAEHQDSALFLHCVMEQVQENVTSQISAAVPDGEGGRPEGPSETAGKNTAAKETRPQGLNSLNHTAFVAYRDRAQRRLKGQKLEEGKESLEDISGELYGSVRVLRGSLSREVSALAVPPSKRVAVLCRVYPFFPELPPKQTDHLLLLLEFEFLLKSLFPNASTPSLSVSRTFHEQLTPPQLIDTLSETLRTPGMYIAQRYVPRSDTLLLALYHRPRPGCVLSHEWESLEMVPVPSLYEFLSFHRLSRDTEEYQTPTCLADLDRERHGNLRLLEQTLMPHDDSVISVATGTSGAGRLFPFPNLEKLEFEERLEQQQETEKLKRPRLRKHAEETDACTEVRREPRFCPEPLHASRCVSVTRPSTSSTFFLREDQAFAEACEELRVFLEAGVQASLALLAAPQGASQPGKEAAGKDREKEKTGLVSSSRQEPEESQKGPVVEDVDLARKNIFWLETASLASFVSHFEDQTRLHIAAHTVELMDAGRSGRTLLAEEVQNARAAVALTFPTGSVVQVTPDGSIWEGNDAALWKRLKQSYGELYAFSTGRYSERSDVLEEDQPTMQPRVQTKFALSENTLYFGCPEDFEIQRRTFPDGRVLRWLLSGRIETFFPDGTVAFRNPSPEEFSLRLSSSHQPPARHLASLRHFVDATLDTLPLDEELPLSPEAAHEAFANGRKDQGIPGHWLFCRPDGSRVGRFKVADDEILFAQSKQGHGGNFDKSLPLDEAARGQEFSSSLARLNASLARHSQTRRAESEWREYELSTLKQAVYPDFQSDTQVVLREDNAVRIDWMHPTEVTPSARKKSVAVHPDGTRIHVEGGPYSEVIKIENENFCHVRIARPPTGTTGTEAAEGEDLETAGLPCQSAILVQAADGTRISISFSERAGQDNERTTQATSITVTRKLEWTVTVREDLQVNVEWTAEHGAPSEKRLRTYSCCLRRKEITTTGDTGDTFVINSEGEVAVRQAAGEETLSVQRPSPGFASPLSTLLFRQAASEEKTNGGERIEDSPEHLSTLGSLRLYAVSCETGEAEEILDRIDSHGTSSCINGQHRDVNVHTFLKTRVSWQE